MSADEPREAAASTHAVGIAHTKNEGADMSKWHIVTATDDQQWPCTIVDDEGHSLLAVHDGTPVVRSRALADRVLAALNAPAPPGGDA